MLSDNAIERLAQPIIDRQEAVNNYVVGVIAERVGEIGKLSPTELHKLNQLVRSGSDIRKINKALADSLNLSVKDTKKLIKTVAKDTYQDMKPFYDYRHKSFLPLEKNKKINDVVKSIEKQTDGTFNNISKAQAFMKRDPVTKKLRPTKIAKTYQEIIDQAIQAVTMGGVDFNTAMRRALRQLADSGIRVAEYNPASGRYYSQRLDTAVRRNILDGVHVVRQGISDAAGEQFGADGKEISVHDYSALDHEPIQGHQFSNEEFDKLQNNMPFKDALGNKFSAIKRAIGIWNCRHFTSSIILGVSKPLYSPEKLQNIIDKNHKGYTFPDGKHITMYEATQYQRELETKIRHLKDAHIMAQKAGDERLMKEYEAKIAKYRKEYNEFSKATKLPIKRDRMAVSGYIPLR